MSKEMYVLTSYDNEDGTRQIIAAMDFSDKRTTLQRSSALGYLLNRHYTSWIDYCKDADKERYLTEICEASKALSNKDCVADCCGDFLSWKQVETI